MQPLLGQIIMFAGNFAPKGWAFCDGRILQIGDNQSLYSILGTTYGGDGRRTFALPDLQGRAPVHFQSDYSTMMPLGNKGELTRELTKYEPGKGRETTAAPYLAVSYIIAVDLNYCTFPSRN